MSILSSELSADPLGRGYAGMSDAEAAADLNTEYRSVHRTSVSGDEMFNVTDATEWSALTDAQRSLWMAFCSRQSVDPYGTANVAFAQSLFGGGSDTIAALAAVRDETVSRARELGIGWVKVGHVQMARM